MLELVSFSLLLRTFIQFIELLLLIIHYKLSTVYLHYNACKIEFITPLLL